MLKTSLKLLIIGLPEFQVIILSLIFFTRHMSTTVWDCWPLTCFNILLVLWKHVNKQSIINKWGMFTFVTMNQYTDLYLVFLTVIHSTCKWILASVSTTFYNSLCRAFLMTDKDVQWWTETEQDQSRDRRWHTSYTNSYM